ncbi:MAG: hypothetical protein H6R10_3217 [Rhodocyclaceae bacterium]|nr:hypothetical protein [Rhodocyclaceae bacterium]
MARELRLVWDNPRPNPHPRNDLRMLRLLADTLAGSIRSGHVEGAKRIASIHHLSPLALGVVATRMFRSGISEDQILLVV